jgi:hypothetical protein
LKKSNVTFFDQTPPSIMHFVHSEEELYCLTQQQVIFICGHSLKESIKMFIKRFLKFKLVLTIENNNAICNAMYNLKTKF